MFFILPALAQRDYYIKKDKQYGSTFLCFNKEECYCIDPEIITIKGKKFVSFRGYNFYDISTYKYDKNTDTYTVDMIIDRDASRDNERYSKCPYDNGNITHLIFNITYTPSKEQFKAIYKGFVSTKDILEYKNGQPSAITVNFLNIYYNNNSKLIKEFSEFEAHFEKAKKTFHKAYGCEYWVEIIYLLKYFLDNSQ